MAGNELNKFSQMVNMAAGQATTSSSGNRQNRIIYPAIVRDIDDKSGQNRIKAEIVFFDEEGNIKGGKDNNTPLDQLPICIPLMPEFFHARPQLGECVLLILENPSDQTAIRYWIGPIRTGQLKMDFESYAESQNIFDRSSFKGKNISSKTTNEQNAKISTIIPQQPEIAVQGKQDANITFKNREVLIRAGIFDKNKITINTSHPCQIQLKQVDDAPQVVTTGVFSSLLSSNKTSKFIPYSQMNILATNINLVSTEGSNREISSDNNNIENITNKDNLERFDDLYKQLHPLVYGDELIKLLKLIINFCLTHVHTPQKPAVSLTEDIKQLQIYSTEAKLQELISKNVRTN